MLKVHCGDHSHVPPSWTCRVYKGEQGGWESNNCFTRILLKKALGTDSRRETSYITHTHKISHIYMHTHTCSNSSTVSHSVMSLCDPPDCSLPGSSIHGNLQARILKWVAIPFSRWSSWPRDWTQVSPIAGRFFTNWGAHMHAHT